MLFGNALGAQGGPKQDVEEEGGVLLCLDGQAVFSLDDNQFLAQFTNACKKSDAHTQIQRLPGC